MTYKLLDLFCGAGGASVGYAQAGFTVTGVDLYPQPRYPFELYVDDALIYLQEHGHEFSAIHASPPCQKYSKTKVLAAKERVDLIAKTRQLLEKQNIPWVIENVTGAPLINPILLCGTMFNLRTYRHRLFETNFPLVPPSHPPHTNPQNKLGRPPKDNEFIHVVGNFSGAKQAKLAMGIHWMTRKELTQAIPPPYTKFIGATIINILNKEQKCQRSAVTR